MRVLKLRAHVAHEQQIRGKCSAARKRKRRAEHGMSGMRRRAVIRAGDQRESGDAGNKCERHDERKAAPRATASYSAVHSGVTETSSVEIATVVYSSEAIHVREMHGERDAGDPGGWRAARASSLRVRSRCRARRSRACAAAMRQAQRRQRRAAPRRRARTGQKLRRHPQQVGRRRGSGTAVALVNAAPGVGRAPGKCGPSADSWRHGGGVFDAASSS